MRASRTRRDDALRGVFIGIVTFVTVQRVRRDARRHEQCRFTVNVCCKDLFIERRVLVHQAADKAAIVRARVAARAAKAAVCARAAVVRDERLFQELLACILEQR